MNNTIKRDHRLKIGFVAKLLFDAYDLLIWKGVAQAAGRFDINLFSYAHENVNFHLIDPGLFDGLIITTGTIDWSVVQNDTDWFVKFYSAVPTVSIGQIVPDASNLIIDNETGLRELIEHFILDHHRREIAFIKGPMHSVEAEARFRVYREVLAKHGIPYKEELVVEGNFFAESGIKAAQTLIMNRKLKPDAIVAANDYMAIFAMKELMRLGCKIPGDIIVGGFDDIQEVQDVVPSLTTVRQPLTELGYKSVEALLSLIKGEAPETIYLPTCPVYRCSCGCHVQQNHQPSTLRFSPSKQSRKIDRDDMLDRMTKTLNERFGELKEKVDDQWSYSLLSSLQDQYPVKTDLFLARLAEMVRKGIRGGVDVSVWYSVIREIETMILQYRPEPQFAKILNSLLRDAFESIGTTAIKLKNEEIKKNKRELDVIGRLYAIVISTFDNNLMNNIAGILPDLQVQSYFLSHYNEDDKEQAKMRSYLNLSHNATIENGELPFPSKKLVPGSFTEVGRRYSFIVLPVLKFGFVVFEIKNFDDLDFSERFGEVFIIIRMAALINTIFYYTNNLEEKIAERTQQLKEAQEHLIETARQAGMAEVAIGVMHNMGNLLNSVGISTESISNTIGDSKLNNLQKANELMDTHRHDLAGFFASDPKSGMLPDFYREIYNILRAQQDSIKNETEQLSKNIALIQQTIEALQDYARRDLNLSMKEIASIAGVIETVLKIQENQLFKNQVKITRDFREIKLCMVDKAKLINILVNLIKNAVEAMQTTPPEERTLLIRLQMSDPQHVMIQITDHGVGISKEQLKNIFKYGYTTKKDGHGFGLHTCFNYMREMGGTLTAESDGIGKGATFSLILLLEK